MGMCHLRSSNHISFHSDNAVKKPTKLNKMYKIAVLCALIVCSQAAPTDKPSETNSTASFVHEKSITELLPAVALESVSTEKREKREDVDAASSKDKKKAPVLSQPNYEENKPPTFVRPVPVDQIIKNSNAAPKIFATHEGEQEEVAEEGEESGKSEDGDTESQQHKNAYHRHAVPTKTSSEAEAEDDNNH